MSSILDDFSARMADYIIDEDPTNEELIEWVRENAPHEEPKGPEDPAEELPDAAWFGI